MINKIILAAALALAACAPVPPRIIDSSCTSFTPIYPSRSDTNGTKQQVLVHNLMWQQVCEGARPHGSKLLSYRETTDEREHPQ